MMKATLDQTKSVVSIKCDGLDTHNVELLINGARIHNASAIDIRMRPNEPVSVSVEFHSCSLDIQDSDGSLFTEIDGVRYRLVAET